MKPLISIIVPIYQVEQYIENCMKSICNQTFNDYEVILVNDGTKDNSIKVAEKILKESKVYYSIINQNNKGVSSARNTGIKKSRGEWIICIDPDDIIYKDFLKTLYESCGNNKVDVGIGNFQYVNSNELFKNPQKIFDSIILGKEILIKNFLIRKINIVVVTILMRKKFLEENNLYYDENMRFSEDQKYIWKVLLSSKKCAYNKTTIYNYFIRENSTMTSSNIEKIMTGYNGMMKFTNDIKITKDNEFARMIMARWVLGVLRSSSKMMNYNEYKILAKEMNYKNYFKDLIFFPEIKTRILSLLLKFSLRMFYTVNKSLSY